MTTIYRSKLGSVALGLCLVAALGRWGCEGSDTSGGAGGTDVGAGAVDGGAGGVDTAGGGGDAQTGGADLGGSSDGGVDVGRACLHGDARLVINELVAAPGGGGNDWVEVLALGAGAVCLGEYTLVDSNEDHEPAALPEGALAAGERLVLVGGGDPPAEGPWHLHFGLGARDTLTLARGGAVVDAVGWSEGQAPGGTSWGRLPDGAGDFATVLPTPGEVNRPLEGPVPLTTPFEPERVIEVHLELAPADWQAMRDRPLEEAYYPGSIVYDGVRLDDVAIRVKGNSSLSFPARAGQDRFSFKVDVNRLVPDQELLGVNKLNFNNGFHDPTLMREHLAYEVMRQMDLPASRTGFVDLWLNDDHMGLYTVVEHVDGAFLRERFDDDEGDLYKPEARGGELTWRGEDIESYPGLQLERAEDGTDHGPILALLGTLNRRPGALPLAEVLDVDPALRYLAAVVAMSIYDSYVGPPHNYYLYEQGGIFTVIPWDLNGAFAIHTCGCERQGLIDFLIDEPTCGPLGQRPLVRRLLADPERLKTYHGYLRDLLGGPLAPDAMRARIQEVAALIRPFVALDERAFFTPEQFEQALEHDLRTDRLYIGLGAFLDERGASIQSQLTGERASTNRGRGSCP